MEDSLLDLGVHLVMTAVLAGALCVASVVAAGAIAFLVWAVARTARGIRALVDRSTVASSKRNGRPGPLAVPLFPRRLRRP